MDNKLCGRMDPNIGRIAFNIGITLLILAILPLFIISWDSAEFYVDIIALIFISIFLTIVIWDVRSQVKKEYMGDIG